jgi:hypothetical protein
LAQNHVQWQDLVLAAFDFGFYEELVPFGWLVGWLVGLSQLFVYTDSYLVKWEVKIKLFLCLSTVQSRYMSKDKVPRIHKLTIRQGWVVSFTLRPTFPRGKTLSYWLDRRLDGLQSWSDPCG